MADFVVDTQVLRDTATILSSIHTEFSKSEKRVDAAIEAAGHGGLEDAISSFATGWDKHRGELLEQLEGLKKVVNGAADTIEQVDSDMASDLEGGN
jgi:uncharacterized protein YukE